MLENDTTYDSTKVGPRTVIKFGPTDYRMWYEAENGANTGGMGYATSTDGLNWTKYNSGAWIASALGSGWSSSENTPGTVLYEGGSFKCWYHSYGTARRFMSHAFSISVPWV
jgi:hypothetical protein